MAIAGNYSFTLQRGANDTRTFQLKQGNGTPMDITGWTPRMQIRTEDGGEGTSTTTSLLLSALPGSGLEITNAALGQITLALTPAQTLLINPGNERVSCAYGVELFRNSPEEVIPLLQGVLTVLPEVVR